jgi:hypothetical protein
MNNEGEVMSDEQKPSTNPFAIKKFVDPQKLAVDVQVSERTLDDAISTHASKFVHYAGQAAMARRQLARAEAGMEILESRLYHEWRTKLTAEAPTVVDGKGKEKRASVTEAQVTAAVKNDSRWWSAKQKVIDARMLFDLAIDARKAIDDNKDLLVQMAVDRRAEREGQLRIGAAKNQGGRDAALEAERNRLAG